MSRKINFLCAFDSFLRFSRYIDKHKLLIFWEPIATFMKHFVDILFQSLRLEVCVLGQDYMITGTDKVEFSIKVLLFFSIGSFWRWKSSDVNLIFVKCFLDYLANFTFFVSKKVGTEKA